MNTIDTSVKVLYSSRREHCFLNKTGQHPKMANHRRLANSGATLKIIETIDHDGAKSQRALAKEAEIALGLANAYVKRFIRKGWVKVVQAPAHRYFYYITPKGFKEKARLTAEYLSDSFEMFRLARSQCDELIADCRRRGYRRIAVVGVSDFAEIAALSTCTGDIEIVAVVDATSNQPELAGIPVVHELSEAGIIDAVIVTDIDSPQRTFEMLTELLPESQILTPPMLRVDRTRRFQALNEFPK